MKYYPDGSHSFTVDDYAPSLQYKTSHLKADTSPLSCFVFWLFILGTIATFLFGL